MPGPRLTQPGCDTAPPLQTVGRIRALLLERDILTAETFHPPFGGGAAYSCGLALGDAPFCGAGFQVTGGGLSPRLALEDAYRRFMAYLSCDALPGDAFPSTDAGDEILKPWQSFAGDCPAGFLFGIGAANQNELAEFLRDVYGETIRCVPYATIDGKTAPLPRGLVRALCGTTGLCAGNTREEAILRGLMDIYERYATRKIFQFRFTAPVVPEALFEGTDVLERIRGLGYPFSIRDCSLGKSFPVVGLGLTRPDGKRAFALGAAAAPVPALERCLALLLQGGRDTAERRFHAPGALDTQDEQQVHRAYCAAAAADGPWPDSVFGGCPLYPLSAFDAPRFDDAAHALRYFLATVAQYGGTLYIRDCSALGYPAYELYMPGASETCLNFTMTREDFLFWSRMMKRRETAYCLPHATGEDLALLASDLLAARHMVFPADRDPLGLLTGRPEPAGAPLRGAFLPLLLGAAKRYALASAAMAEYLDTEESQAAPRRFYQALTVFWQALADGRSTDEVARRYGRALAERCLQSLTAPATLFSPSDWPVCPACDACAFVNSCHHPQIEALSRQLLHES